TFDNNGSIWFTEWTENKLGVITKDRFDQIPISLEVSKDKLVIDGKNNKSDILDIYISSKIINSTLPSSSNTTGQINSPMNITMDATSSLSRDGKLTNITASFSQDTVYLGEKPSTGNGPSSSSPPESKV